VPRPRLAPRHPARVTRRTTFAGAVRSRVEDDPLPSSRPLVTWRNSGVASPEDGIHGQRPRTAGAVRHGAMEQSYVSAPRKGGGRDEPPCRTSRARREGQDRSDGSLGLFERPSLPLRPLVEPNRNRSLTQRDPPPMASGNVTTSMRSIPHGGRSFFEKTEDSAPKASEPRALPGTSGEFRASEDDERSHSTR
jgi:hypothetical protein